MNLHDLNANPLHYAEKITKYFKKNPHLITFWWIKYSRKISVKSLEKILGYVFDNSDTDPNQFLILAVEREQTEIAKYLFSHIAIDPLINNQNAFIIAVNKNYPSIVKLFLKYTDVDPQFNYDEAIISAIKSNYPIIVSLLLKHTKYNNAEIFKFTKIAIEYSCEDNVFLSLSYLLKLDNMTDRYYILLKFACKFNKLTIFKLLLSKNNLVLHDKKKDTIIKSICNLNNPEFLNAIPSFYQFFPQEKINPDITALFLSYKLKPYYILFKEFILSQINIIEIYYLIALFYVEL